MSDIFISYASEDRERIMPLVRALESTGWSVFWDRVIPTGKTWRQVIEEEIRNCRSIIVVWSETSVKSNWVLEEAEEGKRRQILFPVRIDDIPLPFGFGILQTADLIGWEGTAPHPNYDRLVNDIAAVLGASPVAAQKAAEPDRSRKPLTIEKTWQDPTTGMEFVRVQGGCFDMGSPSGEKGRGPYEGPVHEVCLDGFYMGKYAVTNRQYRLFKPEHNSGDYEENSLNGDDQPAVEVSWEDATEYARWLSRKAGKTFRLPTEAEWEYAARAGTKTARFWGDDPDDACHYANVYDKTSERVHKFDWPSHNCDDGFAVTAPAGTFQPNNFGLYDMLGNVWEWTQDWYGEDYYSISPRNNPQGPSSGSIRVIRGGSWFNDAWNVRSANRFRNSPDYRFINLGFRLVLSPGQ